MSFLRSRQKLRALVWVVAVLAVAGLCLRAFVGDVYYVDSSSMEPTLHGAERGGDWVFVLYDDDPRPQRFDLCVIVRPGEREPLVKRVAGLPGETVQLSDGDLLVGGARLGEQAPRPPMVELFDSRFDDFTQEFSVFDLDTRWKSTDGAWRLDSRGLREALANWKPKLLDGYLGPKRERVAGKRHVHDAALELDVRLEAGWRRLVLRLTEEGDLFELELAAVPSGARARVLRRPNAEPTQMLDEKTIDLAPGQWHRLRWSNVDDHLAFDCDGRRAAGATYALNTTLRVVDVGYRHVSPRVAFGGGELVAEFRDIRIERDLHWTDLGQHAIDAAETLGPNEVFVLGDNSGESVDSREWGPIELAHVVGRPVCVVWPPWRWRVLRPREEKALP